jgi:hypothetical protein
MKKLLSIVGLVSGLLLGLTTAVPAAPTGAPWPAIECSNPCIIEDDGGGIIDLYQAQARQMAAGHTSVIVDGPCMSACTIFIDIDRNNVCLTDRALLGYHKSRLEDDTGKVTFGEIDYETPGLNKYIEDHGGLPDPDSGHLLMLNSYEASKFYRSCAIK